MEINNVTLNIVYKCKGPKIAEIIWKGGNEFRGLRLFDFNTIKLRYDSMVLVEEKTDNNLQIAPPM
jgi:hypothetical protein